MAVDNRNFVNTFANEGGADVLVEDKRMDELKGATPQTSSQISTTAQYIPLQDTDGNLVKINPSSFEEAVRNVLGTLLANNDKGTTISAVPALSGSGASLDFGSITPSNLASVLGAIVPVLDGENIDTVTNGLYFAAINNGTTYDLPVDNIRGYFINLKYGTQYRANILVNISNTKVYIRYYSGAWGEWKTISTT